MVFTLRRRGPVSRIQSSGARVMKQNHEREDLPEKSTEDSRTPDSDKRWDRVSEEKLDREDDRDVHGSRKRKKSKDTFFY
jgi:hypothetical protein